MCPWNLNSIAAHTFSKLSLLETYNIQHNFDMIGLLETFLDSSIQINNERLYMKGNKLIRTYNSSDSKKGGLSIHYKKNPSFVQLKLKIWMIAYLV